MSADIENPDISVPLEIAVAQAVEEAGIAGLCRDGRIEVAIETIRRVQPKLSVEMAKIIAERLVGE